MFTFPTVLPPTMARPPWVNKTGVGIGSPISCSKEATGSSVCIRKTSNPFVRFETAMSAPLSDKLALALDIKTHKY